MRRCGHGNAGVGRSLASRHLSGSGGADLAHDDVLHVIRCEVSFLQRGVDSDGPQLYRGQPGQSTFSRPIGVRAPATMTELVMECAPSWLDRRTRTWVRAMMAASGGVDNDGKEVSVNGCARGHGRNREVSDAADVIECGAGARFPDHVVADEDRRDRAAGAGGVVGW